MAVVTRDTSSSGSASSNRVQVATVIGMVVGILCFFGIVAAYQILPKRKRKLAPGLRPFAPPPPKPLPLFTRIRKQCTTFFTNIRARSSKNNTTNDPESHKRHRTLRSFHLFTSEPKSKETFEDEPQRKAAGSLRLNLSFLAPSTGPRAHKRHYTRLDDKDELMGLVRPDAAVLSPWSPLEDSYPSTPASPTPRLRAFLLRGNAPGTPPPLSPPPPAYLNHVPQRPGPPGAALSPTQGTQLLEPNSPTSRALARAQGMGRGMGTASDDGSALPPPSPTLINGEEEEERDITDGTKKLMEEIQNVLEFTRDQARDDTQLGAFVIGDEDDFDDISIYSKL